MKIIPIILITLLSSCTTYKAVGLYETRKEIFIGTVNANMLSGGSSFELIGSSGLKCNGSTTVTHTALTCQGQQGDVFATCNDGTGLRGEWVSQTCKTGVGYVDDGHGGRIAFKFGLSDEQMKAEISGYEQKIKQTQ